MDRRTFLAAMAAGAIVTAEGLWIPGQKLISIPKRFDLSPESLEEIWIEIDEHDENLFHGPSIVQMIKNQYPLEWGDVVLQSIRHPNIL